MKAHQLFDKKIDAILEEHGHANLLGVVYLIDNEKSANVLFNYGGVVRVIFESCKMIKTDPMYVDLCKFEWRFLSKDVPFEDRDRYDEASNTIIVYYSIPTHSLNRMKRFFPAVKTGTPTDFRHNFTKEFMALTNLEEHHAQM